MPGPIDEARDAQGRWTDEGGGVLDQIKSDAHAQRERAKGIMATVAAKTGYDPKHYLLHNGAAANGDLGFYDPATDRVTMYAATIDPYVVAHETFHGQMFAVLNGPEGAKYRPLLDDPGLEKEGGYTTYSREWWDRARASGGWKDDLGYTGKEHAAGETLAELSAHDYASDNGISRDPDGNPTESHAEFLERMSEDHPKGWGVVKDFRDEYAREMRAKEIRADVFRPARRLNAEGVPIGRAP